MNINIFFVCFLLLIPSIGYTETSTFIGFSKRPDKLFYNSEDHLQEYMYYIQKKLRKTKFPYISCNYKNIDRGFLVEDKYSFFMKFPKVEVMHIFATGDSFSELITLTVYNLRGERISGDDWVSTIHLRHLSKCHRRAEGRCYSTDNAAHTSIYPHIYSNRIFKIEVDMRKGWGNVSIGFCVGKS
jgi:hypothetical protein